MNDESRWPDASADEWSRVRELETALREAIGWSYGEPVTPERRDELEALVREDTA